jgi:pyruvate dehydrogenase E1 component beta subunit
MRWQQPTTLAGDGHRGGGDRPAQLRPYDLPTVIESVKKTNRCVVVEEAWPVASMGSHIAAEIMTHAFDYLDAPVARVNGKDVPMPYAANLEKLALPNADEVVEAAKAVLYA